MGHILMSLLIKTNNIKVDGNGPQPEIISLQIKINNNKGSSQWFRFSVGGPHTFTQNIPSETSGP